MILGRPTPGRRMPAPAPPCSPSRRWRPRPRTRPASAASTPNCEEALTELLQPFADDLARAVAAGRAAYDGFALAECLADLGKASCAEARTWEPLLVASHCPFVTSLLLAGDDCQASYECSDGFCQGADPSRLGRCVFPKLAGGQPCDRGEDCASGACHPTLDVCSAPVPGNLCR